MVRFLYMLPENIYMTVSRHLSLIILPSGRQKVVNRRKRRLAESLNGTAKIDYFAQTAVVPRTTMRLKSQKRVPSGVFSSAASVR